MSTTVTTQLDPEVLKARIARFRQVQSEIVTQVRRVIVGQEEVLEQVMIGLFVGGHCLITGLPGTAKTLLVRTMAQTLGLVFKRIQFTPDLMPSDITGTDIIEEDPATGRRTWTFVQGPIFGNILLADEINRTPPKTQSALLEAMQERACTVRGNNYMLPAPFFVLATQNPIELEGTYPLPEAQLDRFLFNTVLDYLTADEELQGGGPDHRHHHSARRPGDQRRRRSWTSSNWCAWCRSARAWRATPSTWCASAAASDETAPDFVKKYVNYGASVRAAQFLVLAAKAKALMRGRYHVTYEDIRRLYIPVLRHRMLLNFHAESDRLKQDDILKRVLEWKAAPRE